MVKQVMCLQSKSGNLSLTVGSSHSGVRTEPTLLQSYLMSTYTMVYALTHHNYIHTVIITKLKLGEIRQATEEDPLLILDLQLACTYICHTHILTHKETYLEEGPRICILNK